MVSENIITACLVALLLAFIVPTPSYSSSTFGSDCGNNKSHNFQYGKLGIFDKLLYSGEYSKEPTFMRKVTLDVRFPRYDEHPAGYITYMELTDHYKDGSGGCAFISNGGIAKNFVFFHLKSQRGGPIGFTFKIYGLEKV